MMKEFIQSLCEKIGCQPVNLLTILRAIQSRYHFVPREAVELLSTLLSIPRTQILGVIEFYSFLHSSPRGRYEVLISDSITDHMLGKHEIIAYLCERLNVKTGEVRADGQVSVDNTSCTGMCDQGPAGLVNGYALTALNKAKIDIIAGLINASTPLSHWPAGLFYVADNIRRKDLLLKNPVDSGAAITAAFARGPAGALTEMELSGLRGRGGAGFKTATKWRFCAEEKQSERVVVCNADEGEPGTFKDRILLNSHAHQVFEGMTVCAAIIGASQGFLYLRGEYLFLYDKLQAILDERRKAGLLDRQIQGQDFDFDISIVLGAGAYICGEESALIESLEGKPGIPRNRPPYPVTQGYLGKPTVVNNVETFFAAAAIAVNGGQWFAATGTAQSKGTKILSICGDCARPGIYEYAFGATIQAILDECGARDVLGVQIGGPSSTFISDQEFGRKLAFEDLATGGSFMIFNNTRSIFDIVQNFSHFFAPRKLRLLHAVPGRHLVTEKSGR